MEPLGLGHLMRMLTRPRSRCLIGILILGLGVGNAHADSVSVTIKGVENPLLANVRTLLSIAAKPDEAGSRSETDIRRLHGLANEEIERALQPFGYYHPAINARLKRPAEGDTWQAIYRIEPGPRVKLTAVRIRFLGAADTDPAFAEARDGLALREGQPLLHSEYSNARTGLLELAQRRGYFDARWQVHRLEINTQTNTARATLVLDSGRRYAFGDIDFGASPLSDELLRGYVPFEPGDPYDASKVRQLRYQLDDSGYFDRVGVQVQRGKMANGRVPVQVDPKMRPENRYTFGIGYGTDTGARVSVGWKDRYLNSSGHKFQTRVEVSQIGTELSARYTIPLSDPARETLAFETSLGQEEIGDGETREFRIGATRAEQLGNFRNTVSLDYLNSEDTIDGETTTRQLIIPGTGLIYSWFDDPVYARRGLRLTSNLRGASDSLGSDVTFLRGTLGGRGVLGLWSGGRLLVRGEIGTVQVNDVDNLPLSQRFFAGGDNSVRGFDYQSLGPTDDDGNVVGGRHLIVGSVELEQLIVGDWGAAVFLDTGNAMNDWSTDLRQAAGVGLRYRSPAGVFKIDVAKAIDGDESPRLHLSLGVDL